MWYLMLNKIRIGVIRVHAILDRLVRECISDKVTFEHEENMGANPTKGAANVKALKKVCLRTERQLLCGCSI